MAVSLILHKRFTKRVNEVFDYLDKEWSEQEARAFITVLHKKLNALSVNPLLGSLSDTLDDVRTISITSHNRLFYKVYSDHVAVLYLKDTRKRRYRR